MKSVAETTCGPASSDGARPPQTAQEPALGGTARVKRGQERRSGLVRRGAAAGSAAYRGSRVAWWGQTRRLWRWRTRPSGVLFCAVVETLQDSLAAALVTHLERKLGWCDRYGFSSRLAVKPMPRRFGAGALIKARIAS